MTNTTTNFGIHFVEPEYGYIEILAFGIKIQNAILPAIWSATNKTTVPTNTCKKTEYGQQ